MSKVTKTLTLAVLMSMALVGPAGAAPPVKDTLHQTNVVQDPQACGFGVRWDIDLTAERTRFYDQSGRLVRAHFQISELNTVTNLTTGYQVTDGPVRFLQRVLYNDDGSITIEANGLSVKVIAETGKLFDVGRFVWRISPTGEVEILQSSGRHAPREAGGGGVGPAVLTAFCDVLRA